MISSWSTYCVYEFLEDPFFLKKRNNFLKDGEFTFPNPGYVLLFDCVGRNYNSHLTILRTEPEYMASVLGMRHKRLLTELEFTNLLWTLKLFGVADIMLLQIEHEQGGWCGNVTVICRPRPSKKMRDLVFKKIKTLQKRK